MILGVPLHSAGFELVAIDMPGYGCTQVVQGKPVSYVDYVQIANHFINFELESDSRPIVLYSISAGGTLTYHAAALNKKVKGIVGTTFLDQRIQPVRDETARNLFMSRVGVSTAGLSDFSLLRSLFLPMSLASKISTLVNDPAALKVSLADRSSAASWASMHLLSSYSSYKLALEPEHFNICPILLTRPDQDKWTPLHLSELVLSRVKKVPVKTVMHKSAGHNPIDDPGLQQMADAIIEFLHGIET